MISAAHLYTSSTIFTLIPARSADLLSAVRLESNSNAAAAVLCAETLIFNTFLIISILLFFNKSLKALDCSESLSLNMQIESFITYSLTFLRLSPQLHKSRKPPLRAFYPPAIFAKLTLAF